MKLKKKTVLTVIIAVVVVLALLLVGFPLFSHLYYGRSQAATLFAWQLGKEAYTTEEAFEEYLEEKREENAEEYALPEEAEFTVSVKSVDRGGCEGFILNESGSRAVFYFPGGSYIDQPRAVHWRFLNELAEQTGFCVVVPIYPKLPDADAETSYEQLTAFYLDCLETDGPWDEIVFMGDSAGGGMALSFAMQLRDAGLEPADKLVLICPWVDVTMENPDIPAYEKKDRTLDSEQLRHLGALWAGDLSAVDPVVSPLFAESFEDLGLIMLITGTGELLYPDIMRFDAALTDAGIDHYTHIQSGMFHVWPLYIGYSIPETEETFGEIVGFLQSGAAANSGA